VVDSDPRSSVQWGYSKGRKRFTRWLSPEQANRYRPGIERGRHLMALLVKLDEVEIRRVERRRLGDVKDPLHMRNVSSTGPSGWCTRHRSRRGSIGHA